MNIDKPDTIEFSYKPEDSETFAFLMNDYSKKLKSIINKIDEKRRKHRFLQLLMLVLSTPIISYLLFFDSSSLFAKLILLALVSVFIFNIFSNTRKLKSLYSDAREVAFKLEKIVRSVSQLHEHAIRNEVQRTEVNSYLAKCESVLEHYYRAKAGSKSLVL